MFAILLLALVGLSAGGICPPPEVLSPCTCAETAEQTGIVCGRIWESFNLKGILDNASAYVNDDVIFDYLIIAETSRSEIEEGAIQHLKFSNVIVQYNPNLRYISPRAFNASRNITTYLSLIDNQIENEAPHERDIFDFFRSFERLDALNVYGNSISSIPSNAFENLTSLTVLILTNNRISSIGSHAFSGSLKMGMLYLSENAIPSKGLSENAFCDMGSLERVELRSNGMAFFERKSFQPLFDLAASIVVGDSYCRDEFEYERFYCDDRSKWICENELKYREKLKGFCCRDPTSFKDIWEFCGDINGTAKIASIL